MKLHGLDLFSGIGGNSLALREYVKTIAYCEADQHAQSVLLSRMSDGSIERAPIWDDITGLGREHFDMPIDIIVAGFPCQDISLAGLGAGLGGKRSGLFFEIMRLAKELKPTFIFLENVPAIRTRGLDRVIQELAQAGYDSRYGFLSAFDVGAPHKRERWFLVAYSNSRRDGQMPIQELSPLSQSTSSNQRRQAWPAEPDVDRVVDGFPLRVDRIKRLGNSVVPQQAQEAFKRLIGL